MRRLPAAFAPLNRNRSRPGGLRWQGMVALILGAILLACGVVLFVSAHWDELGPGRALCAGHGDGGRLSPGRGLARARTITGSRPRCTPWAPSRPGAAIALVGQIFNIQEHWPAAILLWAIAALAGWILLRDEAQQTLTLLLFPAWILSRILVCGRRAHRRKRLYRAVSDGLGGALSDVLSGVEAQGCAGDSVCRCGHCLAGWDCHSRWRAGVRGGSQTFLPFGSADVGLGCTLPCCRSACAFPAAERASLPVAAAIVLGIALPWCQRIWTESYNYGNYHHTYTRSEPNLAALRAGCGLRVFIIWWGVRQASKALVNLGIVGFAISVVWFYFSDIFGKVGRSLGLIGLGVLFLAGGWALEKMRRGLVAGMGHKKRGGAMKLGRISLSVTSLVLLAIQLAIVSTIAAKYLYQRWSCPRVWTRTTAYDPQLLMRGRYLSLQLVVDGCQSTLPSAKEALMPRNVDGVQTGKTYTIHADQAVRFPAKLKVEAGKLLAIRIPEDDGGRMS